MEAVVKEFYPQLLENEGISEEDYKESVACLTVITERLRTSNVPGDWHEDVESVLDKLGVRSIVSHEEPDDGDGNGDEGGGECEDRIAEFKRRQFSGDQRSDEWLKQRMNFITASVSAACAGLMGKASRKNQLLEKATFGEHRSFTGGYYTDKGNIFEEVTNAYYCWKNACTIYEFNLIPHDDPEFSFLGASTDGVTNHLTNIEIKTLVGRPLDPKKFKKEYWHQMQHQMACLDLAITDFIEVKYNDTFATMEEMLEAPNPYARGFVIELVDLTSLRYSYRYSAMQRQDEGQLKEDHETEMTRLQAEAICKSDLAYVRTIWFTMTGYLCRRVERDPEWIHVVGEKLKVFWKEVLELRDNPDALRDMLPQAKQFETCLL